MFRSANKVREKLKQGKPVIGTVTYTWSPAVIEIAGLAGLDFVRVDCEHSWRTDESAEHLMRAAALAEVVPIMRIDGGNAALAMKAYEIGAGGILVVDVETPQDVEEIVRQAKFPPRGKRGYSGQNWSGGWGARAGREWVEWSDRELLVGVMIENAEAVQNVEKIASVEGLDFLLFGPADFSMDIGLGAPDRNHPQVMDATRKTIEAGRKYGKLVIYGVGTDVALMEKFKEMGLTGFELGSDIAVLRSVWSNRKEAIESMT